LSQVDHVCELSWRLSVSVRKFAVTFDSSRVTGGADRGYYDEKLRIGRKQPAEFLAWKRRRTPSDLILRIHSIGDHPRGYGYFAFGRSGLLAVSRGSCPSRRRASNGSANGSTILPRHAPALSNGWATAACLRPVRRRRRCALQ
jgi:hypothetical protein